MNYTDASGNPVTESIQSVVVTDPSGNPVTDASGNPVTESVQSIAVTDASGNPITGIDISVLILKF